ncbi:MAG: hypothetical protein C4K58_00460 [Flavobacteriaceae bacterium]|nr:MAG: hypothetical protein C4K58_00460 [Flavobacteriaceae bacterium]
MKKIFLNKWFLLFSTTLTLSVGYILACAGGDDWGDFYQTNYTPETFVDKSYTPLLVSSDLFELSDDMGVKPGRFDREIVNDWKKFTKDALSQKDLQFFLLDSTSADVNQLHEYYKFGKENRVSEKWSKKIDLKNSNVESFLEFLFLAKQVEKASVSKNESWYYKRPELVTLKDKELILSIKNKYNTAKDPFLKNRYWFQTIKAYFYSDFKKEALDFYQATQSEMPKNTLYYRAMSYIAGIHYKQKQFSQSNYLYSRVFDQCKDLQMLAAYNFHPQEESDWNQSLAMAKNEQEKIGLWAIHGAYGDEEKAIENIYKLNPKSEYLDYLLARLINNTELRIDNSFKEKSLTKYRKAAQDSISISTLNLVRNIASEEKTSKPYMWNMANGYINTLYGNYATATQQYQKAENKMPKTTLAQNQLRLLRFINHLSSLDKISPADEIKLNPDLKWLYEELPKTENSLFRYQNASDWSKEYLSALFHSHENIVMKEIFHRQNGFYENPEKLEKMKAFLKKQSKTEFEKIAINQYSVSLDDILEYQSVLATYENNLDQAISYMNQSDSIKYQQFLGNPFNGKIKDCHDCDHRAKQKRKYSFLDFLLLTKEMQGKIKNKETSKEELFNNNMLLGNAFYNITYYGNGRTFYQGNIMFSSAYYSDEPDFKRTGILYKNMTDCSRALGYYRSAFENATTNEQRAKAQYMMAKCQRNTWYNSRHEDVTNTWEVEQDSVNFTAWDGFKKLKKDYSNTQFYKEVIAECGYFDTYVNGTKR